MLILQQCRNIALSIKIQVAKSHTKPTDTPKLTTGHFIALQRKEIQFHTPEHRHKLPLPEKLDKPLVQPRQQGADSTIKRIYEIKRHLLLGRKVMTNLDSIFKNRDITLPAKVLANIV